MQDRDKAHSIKPFVVGSAILGITIALIGIWTLVHQLTATPHSILVNGKTLVTVESSDEANSIINDALKIDNGLPISNVRFHEKVTIKKAGLKAPLTDPAEAERQLKKASDIEVEAFTIAVNHLPILALPSMKDAEETISLVKESYKGKQKGRCIQSTVKEDMYIDRRFVPENMLCKTPIEAVHLLTTPRTKPTFHMITTGDRAAKLAIQYKTSLAELKMLNPGKDLDRLTEGDRLLVVRPNAPITVISKFQSTETKSVNPTGASNKYERRIGRRQIAIVTTYENGKKTNEETVSQITTWDRPKYPSQRNDY